MHIQAVVQHLIKSKTIGSSAKLDKVNYSITSGGSSVTNGSTTATSSVAIKVNAQKQ